MVKKLIGLLLCAAMLCGLAGCSDDNNQEIVGKWVPTTVTIGGSSVAYSEIKKEGKEFSLTFERSGKCILVLGGIRNEGEYVFNETSVDVTYGGQALKLDYSGGLITLTLNYNNESNSFLFSKVNE